MKKSIITLFIIILILLCKIGFSQTTIYSQNFGVSPATGFPSGWSETGGITGWYMSSSTVSGTYSGASGGLNVRAGTQSTADTLKFSRISTIGYSNITVIWGERRNTTAATPVFQWSSDSITWNTVSFTDVTTNSTWALVNGGTRISLSSGAAGVAYLRFRWIVINNGGTTANLRIDDFNIQGNQVSLLPPSKISFVSVNGGVNPDSCHSFNIIVQTLDVNGIPANVTSASTVTLTKFTGNGTGVLSGGTGTISSGQNSCTITVAYSNSESGVSLLSSCGNLTTDTSNVFTVVPCVASLPSCFAWDTLHGVTEPYPYGWYSYGLGTPNTFGHTAVNSGNFNAQGDSLVIHFNNTSSSLVFYLATYNMTGGTYQFDIFESPNGLNYTTLHSFTTGISAYPTWTSGTYLPITTSRFVKFVYTIKPTGGPVGGNEIAIDDICINPPVCSPAISASANPSIICSGYSSSLSLTGGSLIPGANWYWYAGSCGGTYEITGTSPILSPTVNITYFVRAEGATNTTTCVSVTVFVNNSSPTSIVASSPSVCSGASVTLNESGGTLVSGANWYWYTGQCNGPILDSGAAIIQNPTIQTTYFVMSSGACNTTSCISGTILMSTISPPSAISATPLLVCPGSSTSLNATSAGNTISWWNASSGGNMFGTSVSGIDYPVFPTITTTYYAESGLYTYNTQTYTYSSSQQIFTVPSGLSMIGIDAYGAQGGYYDTLYGKGGLGGRVQANLFVTSGQTLYIYIGGQGTSTVAGWNGGGCGTGCLNTSGYYGGGGGGATDIRIGGTALINRIIVAGGGGGGAYYTSYPHSNGGAGGDTLGGNGVRNGTYTAAYCGSGGSQSAGGLAATSTTYPGATSGSLGIGGASAAGGANAAGGGGGGYYGGGAGISSGGGGGGSNYVNSTATFNTKRLQGFQPGNGQLIISWYTSACTSSRDSITVMVNTISTIPTLINASSGNICPGNSVTLSQTGGFLGDGANWNWYTGSCGGSYVISGISIILSPTITTKYWVRADGTCNTTTCLSKTVSLNTLSTTPTTVTSTSHIICSGSSTTLGITGGSLGTGSIWNWYSGSCGGNHEGTGITLIVSPTFTTYYYIRAEGTCNTTTCASTIITVNIPSLTANNATATQSIICIDSVTTLGIVGGTLGTGADWYWYSGSCVGTLQGSGSTITVSPTLTTVYYTKAEGTCNTTLCVSLTVTVNEASTSADSITASSIIICESDSTILSVSSGFLGTGADWYWYSGSCANSFEGNGSTLTATPTITTDYYVRAEGICNTTTCVNITITVNDSSVSASLATANLTTICESDSTILGITSGFLGTGADWYWYSGSCANSFEGNGSTLTVTPSITTNYYVRAEGICNTTTCVNLTITVNDSSTSASSVTSTSTIICESDSTTLSISAGSLGTEADWFWYSSSCANSFEGNGSTLTVTPTISTDYFVRAEGICNTTTCLNITITVNDSSATASSVTATLTTICESDTTILGITSGFLGTGADWYWYSGSCANSFEGNGSILTVTPEITTDYYVRAEGICNTTTCVNITITVNDSSVTANSATATLTTICESDTTILGITSGFLGTGADWYWYSGSCANSFEGNGSTLTVTPTITTDYFVRAEGFCNTTLCVNLTITVNDSSTSASLITATSTIICERDSTILSVSSGILGTGADWYWYSGSCAGTSIGNGSTLSIAPILTTDYYVRAEGICNTTQCVNITVTVNDSSNSANLATATLTTICENYSTTLGLIGGLLGTNADWHWYSGTCGGISEGIGDSLIIFPTLTSIFFVRAEGICNTTSCISISIIVNSNSNITGANILSSDTICSGTTLILTLSGGIQGTEAIWNWYSGTCGGLSEADTSNILILIPNVTTEYYVRAEGLCNTTSCVSKIITVLNPPLQPDTINGNTYPITGSLESYSVTYTPGVTYTWTAPSGWVGTSTSSSITYIVGLTSGIISVVPNNSFCIGTGRSLILGTGGLRISGNFNYDNTSVTPLDSVWVFLMLNGTIIDSTQADYNGYYEFNNIPNGSYNITATSHKPWGGVNSTDAVKVKRHFAGSELFTSSIVLHAADVNFSYGINTTDAVKICRRFVGSDTSFTRGDWLFEKTFGGDTINVSTYMNDTVIVNGSNITQNYKGLCVGDVNESYIPFSGAKLQSKVLLNYEGIKKLNSNEYFNLPIIVSDNIDIGAISLIFNYPKELIQIINVQCVICNESNNFFYNSLGDELRIGWFESEKVLNLKNNESLIMINGKTTGNFKHGNTIKFSIANNPQCEIADVFGNPINNVALKTFGIEYSEIKNTSNIENISLNDIFIYPNPANDKINIKFNLSDDGFVKASIFNILGEKIIDIVNSFKLKGNYSSDLNISSLPPGIYDFKIILDNKNIIVKRIIISR